MIMITPSTPIMPKHLGLTPTPWRRLLRLAAVIPCVPLLALACSQPTPPGSSGTLDGVGTDEGDDTDDNPTNTSGDDTGDDTRDTTDTSDTDTDTDTDADTSDPGDTGEPLDLGVFADTLYPLAEGAAWTYIIKNTNGQVLGMDIVDTTEIDWDGEPAWQLTDNPNSKGEWTKSVILRDDTLSARVHKEIQTDGGTVMIVDYDPGFARVDDSWDTLGFSDELLYERTEVDGDGLNPKVEDRGHLFTVVDVHEQITVPAGTFDCVQIERVRTVGTNAGELVISWYAFGVGKVREERPAESKIEELASVSLPGGVNLP